VTGQYFFVGRNYHNKRSNVAMGRLIQTIGQRIMISNRHNSVRKGVIFLVSNLLLFAGLVFAVEIALILLGIGNVFLPWTRQALEVVNKFLF
jgi:hypothetical protein